MKGEENSHIGRDVCVFMDDRKTRSEGGTGTLRPRTISMALIDEHALTQWQLQL